MGSMQQLLHIGVYGNKRKRYVLKRIVHDHVDLRQLSFFLFSFLPHTHVCNKNFPYFLFGI